MKVLDNKIIMKNLKIVIKVILLLIKRILMENSFIIKFGYKI